MLAIRLARSDATKSEQREALMDAHKAHLRSGRINIIQSGPLMNDDPQHSSWGGLIIADVSDLHAFREFSDNDPFVSAAVYDDIVICEWTKTIG